MKILSLFFLLALVASTFGLKVRDLHLDTTVVSVSDEVTPDGVEHILIELDRIEDDVSDAGQLLSERDIRVALRFTYDQSQVFVNDVPAPVGFSELAIQAQIFEFSNGEHVPLGEVMAILIRVNVQMDTVVVEGAMVNTLTIQERVVGIQSTEVWQADVIQQKFIVQEDGSVVRFDVTKVSVLQGEPEVPPEEEGPEVPPEEEKPRPPHPGKPGHHGQGGHHHGQGGHHGKPGHQGQPADSGSGVDGILVDPIYEPPKKECAMTKKAKELFHEVERWFHSLSFPLRVLVSFAGGIVVGLITISLMKLICGLCCSKKRCCQAKQQQPADYKANLKVYSLQYTALPQEDKDQKDQKGSIEMV